MGWDINKMLGPQVLILSTLGGLRKETGEPLALGFHTGHWELGLLVRAKQNAYTDYELTKEMVRFNKFIPFKEFFYYESEQWSTERVNLNYAQAWSIVYFALKGENENFKKDFCKLFAEFCKDRNAAEVIPEVIDDKEMAAYEAAWIAYWKKM